MGGVLIVLVLLAAIVYVFLALLRKRVRTNLDRLGHELPAELKAQLAAPRAGSPAASARVASAAAAPKPAAAAVPALHFMLIYELPPDFIQRRAPYRDQHLALAWQAADRGELVLAGALEEPATQAFLLFRGTREAARRFAESDPYVARGLVTRWHVRQWHTVAGATAAMPLRPARPL
jgi:uncharacterized protein